MEEVKSKKKQKIAILSVMIALFIAVMCLGGGIAFARYVTKSSNVSKTATVAKWGYVVTVNANNMFSSDYGAGDSTTHYATATDADNAVSVKANASSVEGQARNMLVAPGTKGEMSFTIKGSAEVLSQVTINFGTSYSDVVLVYTDGTKVDGSDTELQEKTYNPIKWSLTKSGESTALVENGTLAECQAKFATLQSLVVNPGTAVDDTYTLSWAWAFENGSNDAEKELNNTLDTILANVVYNAGVATENQVAYPTGYSVVTGTGKTSTSISFTLNVGVEQIQNLPSGD